LISNTNSHLEINSTIVEYHDKVSEWKNDSKVFIDKYLKEFDIGESLRIDRIEGAVSRVYLKKKEKEILLSDLGYGYSQLLPILLKIKIASLDFKTDHVTPTKYYKGKILIIEEPESNLHPDFQSKLADLFVEASEKFNIQFIIETHSEYLIRKLQYLTAKKKIKPRDTSIYYFYNPENIPEGKDQIKKIEIQETGKLSETFGAGFFDESTRLLLSLIDDKILN
jgi:predicted ATPase